jgi:hypothetical protein
MIWLKLNYLLDGMCLKAHGGEENQGFCAVLNAAEMHDNSPPPPFPVKHVF